MSAAPHTLVVNAGSSNLKWTWFDSAGRGDCRSVAWADEMPEARRAQFAEWLASQPEPDAVGHRVVHGGASLRHAVRLTPAVRQALDELAGLAPLHQATSLALIDAVADRWPGCPQVLAFDTAFHATLPAAAALYALPAAWTRRWALQRYGFHGLSVESAVQRTSALSGQRPERLIVCHLGSGCSVTAVRDGISIDTSMGLTPLEGLVMGTRAGSIDPGLLLYLLEHGGFETAQLRHTLEHESGLLGISGLCADLGLIEQAADAGNAACGLAVEHFHWCLRRAIGAMTGVLGGVDALAFTGGIGEHRPRVREAAAQAVPGCALEPIANRAGVPDSCISAPDSRVAVFVIEAREDRVIRAQLAAVLA